MAEYQAAYFGRKETQLKLIAVSHCYGHFARVATVGAIQANICYGYQVSVHGELVAFQVVGANWRMMADLLVVYWNSSHVALESLSQYWIEGFLHNEG